MTIYFVEIGPKFASDINCDVNPNENENNSIFISYVTEYNIMAIIKGINNSYLSGLG